jgi:hypothetical protein
VPGLTPFRAGFDNFPCKVSARRASLFDSSNDREASA